MDFKGWFPITFSRCHAYIMVCYVYETNNILVRPMKNGSAAEHIRVYKDLFTFLDNKGLHPTAHIMNNKSPKALRSIIADENKNKLELVSTQNHKTNPAEKCINIFSHSAPPTRS